MLSRTTERTVRVLHHARILISDAERYTPVDHAATLEGRWVPVGSADAVRFSVMGAVLRVGGGLREVTIEARRVFQDAAPGLYARVASSEDPLTHAEALALLDAALARVDPNDTRKTRAQSGTMPAAELPARPPRDGSEG